MPDELTQMRLQQARELADLDAQLKAATQEKLVRSNEEKKVEVEKRRAELEKIQQELEVQAELRRSQLNDSSEITKRGEELRQEMLNRCREQRKKELEIMNAERKMDQGQSSRHAAAPPAYHPSKKVKSSITEK